jgi:hypothetical protein
MNVTRSISLRCLFAVISRRPKPLKIQFPFRPSLCRLAVVLSSLGFSGCVSSKYKLAEYEKQAAPMNIVATPSSENTTPTPAVDAMLNTVIVLQGPGSWKHNAYWDEYVVSLTNRSGAPLTLESVILTDFQGQNIVPGTNPWELEKQSRDFESRVASTAGDVLKIGGGVVLASGTGLAAGGLVAVATGTAGWAAVGMVGAAFIAAIPVYAAGTVYRNVSSKHKIEEEFARRSLVLPLALPPGRLAQGSLFFRVAPGPQRLVLRARTGDTPVEFTIELTSLNGLHLKQPPAGQQSPPSSHSASQP